MTEHTIDLWDGGHSMKTTRRHIAPRRALFAAALLLALTAMALGQQAKRSGSLQDSFARLDRNGDGKIGSDELARGGQALRQYDANGDDEVTLEEIQALYAAR